MNSSPTTASKPWPLCASGLASPASRWHAVASIVAALWLAACDNAVPPAATGAGAATDSALGQDSASGQDSAAASDAEPADATAADVTVADSPESDSGATDASPSDINDAAGPDAADGAVTDAAAEPDAVVKDIAAPDVGTPDAGPAADADTAAPDAEAEVTPDAVAEVAIEVAEDAAADAALDVAQDVAVEVAAEVVATDAAPEVAPEVASTDAAVDTAGDAAEFAGCQPSSPPTEQCDGIDNDCDGTTDGDPALCDDANSCTADSCSGKNGCKKVPQLGACDDGDPCSTEACDAGSCKAAPKVCDDGDACTADQCNASSGACQVGPPKSCDDANVCTDDSCAKASGCVNLANATTCSDANACTEGDKCKDKACGAGAATVCDDGNPCTTDSCDPKTGCKVANNTAVCDDGDKCTSDVCASGTCAGTAKSCDDKDACTSDACDPGNGACTHGAVANCKACATAADCNDNNACTTDACASGKCNNTKIVGCLGPPDFNLSKLVGVPATIDALAYATSWGNTKFAVDIGNSGKTAAFTDTVALEFWVSTLDKLGGTKLKFGSSSASAANISTTAPKTVGPTPPPLQNIQSDIKPFKFICMVAVFAGDPNPADNVVCAPTQFSVANLKVEGVVDASSGKSILDHTYEVGGNYNMQVVLSGDGAAYATLSSYRSIDATIDASDIGLATTNVSLPALGTAKFALAVPFPVTMAAQNLHICGKLIFPGPAAWNPIASDDAKCVPTKLTKRPDLAPSEPMAGNADAGGLAAVVLGMTGKFKAEVANTAGNAPSGAYDIKFSLEPAAGGAAMWSATYPAASVNASAWGSFASPDVKTTLEMLGTDGVGANKVKLCVTVDPDNKVEEINETNNVKCKLFSTYAAKYSFVATGAPATVKINTTISPTSPWYWQVKNEGNHTGVGKWGAKLILSKDDKLSAEDVVLLDHPSLNGVNPGALQLLLSAVFTFKVPTSFGTGPAFLLFVIDPANLMPELVESDNVKAVAVTVVP